MAIISRIIGIIVVSILNFTHNYIDVNEKSRNDASHRRGLMNEAVKIGSYEDDDYYENEKR